MPVIIPIVSKRISKRSILVLLLSAGQFACLAIAVLYFASLIETGTRQIVRKRVLETSRHTARETAKSITSLDLGDISPGSPGWDRLQKLVEDMRLPNGGFVCVIDGVRGEIICHPELAERPALAGAPLGEITLHRTGQEDLALFDVADSLAAAEDAAGWVELPVGLHLVAVRSLPGFDAYIVAHQPEESIRAVIAEFVARIRLIGLGITIALAVLLTFVNVIIIRRYENRLAHINENLEDIVEERTQALLQSRSAVILGLAKLAESRDDETGKHLERIRRYVQLLARALARTFREVDENFINTIIETSSLHDIGKVGIPDDVLLKPGKLTDEQREIIQKHPLIGGDTLLAVKQSWGKDQFLVTACEIAFAHHERYDGTGYPFGLKGDVIPLSARIVALADVYDALTTKRVYKPAMPHEEAVRIITEGAGAHFDPALVDAFLATEARFREVRDELAAED